MYFRNKLNVGLYLASALSFTSYKYFQCLPENSNIDTSQVRKPAIISKNYLQAKKKDELILIAGNGNKLLAQNISHHLGIELASVDMEYNFDGEVTCYINTSVNGKDVFIIQPCAYPVNDKMMELMLAISCAKRAGARKVTAVVPYFGYKVATLFYQSYYFFCL